MQLQEQIGKLHSHFEVEVSALKQQQQNAHEMLKSSHGDLERRIAMLEQSMLRDNGKTIMNPKKIGHDRQEVGKSGEDSQ